MAWFWLVLAGVLEVVWAVGLKYSEGFTRPWITTFTLATMAAGFWMLAEALKEIPLGTGYAVWVGIGAVGTAILAVILFNEPVSVLRVMGILLIITGIIALKLA